MLSVLSFADRVLKILNPLNYPLFTGEAVPE